MTVIGQSSRSEVNEFWPKMTFSGFNFAGEWSVVMKFGGKDRHEWQILPERNDGDRS